MTDLAELGVVDALELMARREVSSEELLDAHLTLVERRNPSLNLVVSIDDRARGRCRHADRLRSRGELVGRLHGLPMTVKDSFETEGLRTTAGAEALAMYVPRRDAAAVARLRAAGAIVFGKSNLPEFAADLQSHNALFGLSRNPWDASRTVGGSSGGAAGALAAGFTLLELGSDIGGSIRGPAHHNGVAGHKPTWGAVPTQGHIPGPPGTLAPPDLGVVGPMARHVQDLELAMTVLADGAAGGVPGATLPPAVATARSATSLRVALWCEDPAAPTSREIRDAIRGAGTLLADAGATVDDHPPLLPRMRDVLDVYLPLVEAALGRGAGGRLSHREWLAVDEQRHRLGRRFADVFATYDAVIAPCAPVVAFPHDIDRPFDERYLDIDGEQVAHVDHLAWAAPATLGGLPATAVPIGCSTSGLPIGLQVIGPQWGDRTTLAAARAIEELTGGFAPPVAADRSPTDDRGAPHAGAG